MSGTANNNVANRCSRVSGFTLVEVLVLAGIATLAIVGAMVFHRWIDGSLGWVLGGLAGFLLAPLIAGAWALFTCLVRDGIPTLPRCRNGSCHGSDYELRRFGEEFYWVCKCGDRYVRQGRRFLQVTDDGETVVCRIWRPFRGWYSEEERGSNQGRDGKGGHQ